MFLDHGERNLETLNIKDEDGVRLVEMDRPEALNAFSSQLMDDLAEAFLEVASDDSISVLLLTGAGRAFSAGADLAEMGREQSTPEHGFPGLLDAIINFPKPFIVAVNGIGVGIGATICGLADLSYMSDKAKLRAPFSALGLTAEAASTFTFPQLMGRQRASWFLLSAEWMTADECVDAGLALEAVPAEDLLGHAMAKAKKLAGLPLPSLQTTKGLIMDPVREQMKASIIAENKGLAKLVSGAANREALTAFMEKREPDFSNL